MPQGTFVPSHCSSFSPKQRALFYTWIHFIQQLAVFFKHIFTARLTTGLLCALLPDSHHSHAPTQFAPDFFLILFFRERFNLESFIGLGFIWSCERCRRIKSSIERGGKRLTRLLKGLESFWSTMERKARASGTGAENPITWLCSFNTFYVSFFWNIHRL